MNLRTEPSDVNWNLLRTFCVIAEEGGITAAARRLRMSQPSVSLALQSCLGGLVKDFRVQHLNEWCFRFEVHSKAVGFLVYNLRSFVCHSFAVHFALWGNGGPNWKREFAVWCDLEDSEWTLVTRKRSYATVVRQ